MGGLMGGMLGGMGGGMGMPGMGGMGGGLGGMKPPNPLGMGSGPGAQGISAQTPFGAGSKPPPGMPGMGGGGPPGGATPPPMSPGASPMPMKPPMGGGAQASAGGGGKAPPGMGSAYNPQTGQFTGQFGPLPGGGGQRPQGMAAAPMSPGGAPMSPGQSPMGAGQAPMPPARPQGIGGQPGAPMPAKPPGGQIPPFGGLSPQGPNVQPGMNMPPRQAPVGQPTQGQAPMPQRPPQQMPVPQAPPQQAPMGQIPPYGGMSPQGPGVQPMMQRPPQQAPVPTPPPQQAPVPQSPFGALRGPSGQAPMSSPGGNLGGVVPGQFQGQGYTSAVPGGPQSASGYQGPQQSPWKNMSGPMSDFRNAGPSATPQQFKGGQGITPGSTPGQRGFSEGQNIPGAQYGAVPNTANNVMAPPKTGDNNTMGRMGSGQWQNMQGAASPEMKSESDASRQTQGMAAYRESIAKIETPGKKDPWGTVNSKTGALGRYQVMPANLKSWTTQALGQPMSAQEFLKNPAAQNAVFDHQFGQSVQKYGNPQDAASVWFTGKPTSAPGAAHASDGNMTGSSYVAAFSKNLGAGEAPGASMGFAGAKGSPYGSLYGAEGGKPSGMAAGDSTTNEPQQQQKKQDKQKGGGGAAAPVKTYKATMQAKPPDTKSPVSEQPPPPMPKVGQVFRGKSGSFRYTGGNPSDYNSWAPVQ